METTLKFSEAIRLGCLLRQQGFGNVYTPTATCAFGAALDAIGINEGYEPYMLPAHWKRLLHSFTRSPTRSPIWIDSAEHRVMGIVTTLNDAERWTREQIADWIEGVEKRLEAEQRDSEEVVVTA